MKSLAAVIGCATLVAAHGWVDNATIGGQYYQPYQDPYMSPAPQRVSREVQGNGPVEDVTLPDLQCGGWSAGGVPGPSKPAALHANAKAGETVNLKWTLWPDSHKGPTITYMARCPDTGCNNWQPGTSAVWFKIQEEGRSGTSNTWATSPLEIAGNAGVNYKIPSCLKPGYYLVRHEIIALHGAWAPSGAQFYPNCHQLQVSGSGTTVPKSNLAAFPGTYKATDPGISYDMYNANPYTIPGPPVFSC
ncbi:lytic polysaccharide monooxygenase [Patellaria atrata CBS 101060]|uniref:lytic cellulose monooxygenase (C4-dehydrogenating) n=1 Tax=Patellaria atrata CBS 101060 TaxID=1346257 RepID=A0A9P4VS57_9PEZI|nr:lytic polysaccharide monooxygenase [Patellaria atrata CBS 101060]